MYLIYLNDNKRIDSIIKLKTLKGVKNRLKNYVKPLNYKKGIDTYHIYFTHKSDFYKDKKTYITSVKA